MKLLWPIAGSLPVTNDSDAHLARVDEHGNHPYKEAVDFAAWTGTEWLSCAPKTARVVKSSYDSEQGHHIWIQWHDTETDWLLRARYAHGMMAAPFGVGALVEPQEGIGWVGATGRATGPHLHFVLERWTGQDWARLRPEDWLDSSSQPGETNSQPQLGGDMTADEKAEALALLDILYGCARVLASEQTAPDTLASLGQQAKDAVLRLKELVESG